MLMLLLNPITPRAVCGNSKTSEVKEKSRFPRTQSEHYEIIVENMFEIES